jgi:hypothetical protein
MAASVPDQHTDPTMTASDAPRPAPAATAPRRVGRVTYGIDHTKAGKHNS